MTGDSPGQQTSALTGRRMLWLAALVALLCAAVAGLLTGESRAGQATVAVAANFLSPLREIEQLFEADGAYRIEIVSGSTGQLYAQILNGAPFDVLLAADQDRPALLVEQAAGDPASRFTYAVGRLALWSKNPGLVDDATLGRLGTLQFRWLAIANPALAPYGVAAREALTRLDLWSALGPRIVHGQNIGQTFALVESGGAELGLVALSQVLGYQGASSHAVVPAALHEPIRQDAIVLEHGLANPAARAFAEYLAGDAARAVIARHGYDLPPR